jgi:cytochrome P450
MFPSAKEIRVGPALNGCVYLRAAINEAMRLSPSVAQPLWRQTERGGCFIDGQFIPGGLNVGSGLYSLHHNPIAFQDPFNYVIERWIVRAGDQNEVEQQKERIKEMSKSFAPFSVGPRQCIAKNFALMELMLAMAYVFWRFDFKSADGQDGRIGEGATQMGRDRGRTGEFQMKSYFTSHMKGPMVRFKKREI